MDVDNDEEFSTLDAFDIPIDEKTINSVSDLQISEEMEKITHVPTTKIKIQVSEVSFTDQEVSESNNPEMLGEKSVSTEILVKEDYSHAIKATKDSEPYKTRKYVHEKTTEVAQDATAMHEVIV
ncbi:hypothetical protein KI387_027064, partial [Taxus chinensis]